MIVLLGVPLVVIGFALRVNPLLVVTVAGIVSALLDGLSPLHILDAFGTGFANSRSITIAFIVLPVIGLLERYGLQQRAKILISQAATLTAGRLLLLYLFVRQLAASLGLTSIGGAPQMVRPVIYPMAEGAAMRLHGELPERVTETIKAHSAAADTVGVFFGEDCFVAIGSVLLITSYVDANYHLKLEPLQIAIWAIPTAIAAFAIHGFRLLRLDAQLAKIVEENSKRSGDAFVITAEWIYWLCGFFFFTVGAQIAFDRAHQKRWTNAAFWCTLGVSLCYGSFIPKLPAWPLGVAVIAMALTAGFGLTGPGSVRTTSDAERTESAKSKGNLLFIPALTIPIVTILISVGAGHISIAGRPIFATGSQTLVGLGIATIAALIVAAIVLRPKNPAVALIEGRRLLESIGWAALLPQMLATLGLLFTQAGVGTQVGAIAHNVVPENSRVLAVIAYAVGMAAFTIVMGNAFAAFPIMTAAIGWPLLVQGLGAHPAPLFAIGMLSGFCGTLCTPMAANFNLVPPALLEMRDKYGQIKVQIPTAICLLAVNILFLLFFPFR